MIHLKYKCKVNFVKLPLIWTDLCLKLVFENATAGRKTGCRSVVNCTRELLAASADSFWWDLMLAIQTRFTWGHVRELKNAHNSVTVENQTHFYMNFFAENHTYYHFPKSRWFLLNHLVYTVSFKLIYEMHSRAVTLSLKIKLFSHEFFTLMSISVVALQARIWTVQFYGSKINVLCREVTKMIEIKEHG